MVEQPVLQHEPNQPRVFPCYSQRQGQLEPELEEAGTLLPVQRTEGFMGAVPVACTDQPQGDQCSSSSACISM